MKKPYDDNDWLEQRNRIIGLGEHSQRKSYYPELKRKFEELEKFKTLLDSSTDFIFLIEIPSGRIVDANETVCSLLKYKKLELFALKVSEIFLENPVDAIENVQEKFFNIEKQKTLRTKLVKKDGTYISVESVFSKTSFKGKNYVIIVARDISERERFEEALKTSEMNMRILFNASRDAIIIHDESGRIYEINDQMLALFEVDRLTIQSFSVHKLSANGSLTNEDILDLINKTINYGDQILFWKAKKIASGREFWAEVFLRVVTWHGRRMIMSVMRDITEKKLIEEALKESEEKYRLLFEKMLDAFCICEGSYDGNGELQEIIILDVNPAFNSVTGVSLNNLQKKFNDFLRRNGWNYWKEIFEKAALKNINSTVEAHIAENNKYFSVSVFGYNANKFAIVLRNITESKIAQLTITKQLSDLEAKNTEMERFTYTVSHDLRSPLITIKGFAGAIKDDIKENRYERVEADLKRIENAAEKMQFLLEDLLELSRIGRIVNPSSTISMYQIACEVCELLHGVIVNKKINIIVDKNLPDAYGDISRIREVVQNLVENAVKFLETDDNPTIKLGFRKTDNDTIYFVQDNGPGIDPQYHKKIFGLFDKLNAGTEGTGIGLALVKRIVELHGGKVWVESQLGEGAVFCFTLNDKNL